MTLSAYLDDEYACDIASTGGWSDLLRWLADADPDATKYPELAHLTQHEWSQHLDILEKEIDALKPMAPPKVLSTLQSLIQAIGLGQARGQCVLVISDGVGSEDEPHDS